MLFQEAFRAGNSWKSSKRKSSNSLGRLAPAPLVAALLCCCVYIFVCIKNLKEYIHTYVCILNLYFVYAYIPYKNKEYMHTCICMSSKNEGMCAYIYMYV